MAESVSQGSLSRGWVRFRSWPWWGQALIWLAVWPVPLAMHAATHSARAHRRWVALTAVVSLVWVGLVLVASSTTEFGGEKGDPAAAGAGAGGTSATAGVGTADETSSSATNVDSQVEGNEEISGPAAISHLDGPFGPGAGAPANTTGEDLLDQLTVVPEGSREGYHPDLFVHWSDLDGDGCDTRQEVLISEEVNGRAQIDPSECRVVAGEWFSVYDGASTTAPTEFEIDHVVDLAEAWDSGASSWSPGQRQAFANDLGYEHALVAVSASSNAAKGDKDPAEWRPAREAAWCFFATAWTTTKVRWALTAGQAEVDALRGMFRSCNALSTGPPAVP